MSAMSGASNPRDAQKSRSPRSGASFSRLSRSICANADSFGACFFVVVIFVRTPSVGFSGKRGRAASGTSNYLLSSLWGRAGSPAGARELTG